MHMACFLYDQTTHPSNRLHPASHISASGRLILASVSVSSADLWLLVENSVPPLLHGFSYPHGL